MLAKHIRRSARDVAAAGWRPTIDPSVRIPVVIRLPIYDDHVERLGYAYLAVTLRDDR